MLNDKARTDGVDGDPPLVGLLLEVLQPVVRHAVGDDEEDAVGLEHPVKVWIWGRRQWLAGQSIDWFFM